MLIFFLFIKGKSGVRVPYEQLDPVYELDW